MIVGQFLAMLSHRLGTLRHLMAATNLKIRRGENVNYVSVAEKLARDLQRGEESEGTTSRPRVRRQLSLGKRYDPSSEVKSQYTHASRLTCGC